MGEYEEILGYHLEQAYRYLAELGPLDEPVRTLATQAAERLGSAGRRAFDRADMAAAATLLSRAVSLLPDDDRSRLELSLYLGRALEDTGDLARAEAELAQAIEGAVALDNQALEFQARLEAVLLQMRTDRDFTSAKVLEIAKRAIQVFEVLRDDRRLARAWTALAYGCHVMCKAAATEKALQRALEHARRAGDDRPESASLGLLVGSAFCGPTPAKEGIRRCEEVLARHPDKRRLASHALAALACLKAMEANFEEARELIARARGILRDLGMTTSVAGSSEMAGFVELLAGDPAAAEKELRAGYETLEQMGEMNDFAAVAGVLAEAVRAQGREEEAFRLTEICEEAARDYPDTQVAWRVTRAKVLAGRGRVEEAEALAREAVGIAEKTDWLNLHADALMSLGEVLRLAGNPGEARAAIAEAAGLYEQKGNLVSSGRASTALADVKAGVELTKSTR